MKKRFIYTAVVALAAATLLGSCEDQLDISNPNQKSSSDFWQTDDQVASALNSAFNMFNHNGFYKRHLYMAMNIPSDEMTPNTSFNDFNNWNYINEPDSWDGCVIVWQAHYQQIAHINRVLYYAEKVEWDDPNMKNYVVGQAKFLRALAYYDLVLQYNKCPLILEPQLTMGDYYPASNTWQEVWAQVIADFKDAASLLPASWNNVEGSFNGQVGRPTWGAATAYEAKSLMIRNAGKNLVTGARAAEFQEDLQTAKTLLKSVIDGKDGVTYSLVNNYYYNFDETHENNSESIFEIQFDETGSTVNWGGTDRSSDDDCDNWLAAYFFPTCWDDLYATKWIGDYFDGADPRKYFSVWQPGETYDGSSSYRGIELSNVCYGDKTTASFSLNMNYSIAKYTRVRDHVNTTTESTAHGTHINFRLMRFAEVKLLYAECLVKLEHSVSDEAAQQINDIRGRVDLEALPLSGKTEEDGMDAIEKERICEFAFESIRWIDIIRWGKLYDPVELGNLCTHDSGVNTDANCSASNGFDKYTEGFEFMPVPQVELDYNANLKKNAANTKNAADSDYEN